MDRVTGQLKDIVNGSGTEDQSSRNLDVVATTFDMLAELNHTVSVQVCYILYRPQHVLD